MSGPVHPPRQRPFRGRRIALVVWLVVLLAVAVPTVWAAVSYAGQPEDERVPSGGGVVVVGEPGEYGVYAETTSGTAGRAATVRSLTAPSGAAVPVRAPDISENYTVGSREGIRVGTFTATETGPYRLVGDNARATLGDELVVSTRTIGSVIGIVGGAVATGAVLVVGLVAGLVMLLTRGRRRPPAAPYGPPGPYPPPYAAPPPYPGAPYPAPHYQQYPGPEHPGPRHSSPTWSGPPDPARDDPTVSTRRPGEPSGPDDRA